jgi:hypothetical protein
MPGKDPMTSLYDRLGSLGFPRRYLREVVLPEWWDDEVAHNPAGYAQGLLVLSRNLGLDLASLQNGTAPVGLRNLGPCKFKKTASKRDEELIVARIVTTRVASMAAAAAPKPSRPFSTSAAAIRETILSGPPNWVGLAELIEYCWSVGVPVLHVPTFPEGARKMDGMAWVQSGRKAIVLCKNCMHSAWLLFILAHELGHIARGHLGGDGALVDEEVDQQGADKEEQEANAFALELLTGNPTCEIVPVGEGVSAGSLVTSALQLGMAERIDPGHIVLNCAHQAKGPYFALANAALNLLEPNGDAPGVIHKRMLAYLDRSAIPEETFEFILRATGARVQP